MPSFSKRSKDRLETCDIRLQELFIQVVKDFDCTILEGYRSEARQAQLLADGRSQVAVSKHNHRDDYNKPCALAVDVAPYPIDWSDRERFTYFAGVVRGVAFMMGLKIRWGGNWDSDLDLDDNEFDDLNHWELEV